MAAQEWADALSISITVETEPGENLPAEVATEGLVMEDGETLYVAFIAEDPRPEQIRAFIGTGTCSGMMTGSQSFWTHLTMNAGPSSFM